VTSNKPIFEYDDFRAFLKDLYESAKKENSKFSFRYFARIGGSKSPSFFKQVIEGQRNLTARHIDNLIRNLKFTDEEAYFFKNLVQLNQAKTVEEKQPFILKIQQSKTYQQLHPLSLEQYDYLVRWYCVPIRELVGLSGFSEDPQWIAKQLNFPITESQIETAIAEMLKLGILTRNEHNQLVQKQAFVGTDDRIISSALAKSHQELIKMGAESIDRIPREDREILGVTFTFSQANMAKVKASILEFRKEMMDLIASEPNPDAVYQFHLLLFPLAQLGSEEKEKK